MDFPSHDSQLSLVFLFSKSVVLCMQACVFTTFIVLPRFSPVLSYFVAVFCENFSDCPFGLEVLTRG